MRPGELSMSHRGVLFLDELPEFKKNVLEVLRQPLEEGQIHLARANLHLSYPCQVMMVAAMNPCPCGWFNVPTRGCQCKEQRVLEYHQRVSGPLMDRIDISVEVRPVDHENVMNLGPSDRDTAWYRNRVEAARERQRRRFKEIPWVLCNAQMGPREVRRFCRLNQAGRSDLAAAIKKHGLSARAHDRILKLARSRADLEGHDEISSEDLNLAIDCRILDRRGWLRGGVNEGGSLAKKYGMGRRREDPV